MHEFSLCSKKSKLLTAQRYSRNRQQGCLVFSLKVVLLFSLFCWILRKQQSYIHILRAPQHYWESVQPLTWGRKPSRRWKSTSVKQVPVQSWCILCPCPCPCPLPPPGTWVPRHRRHRVEIECERKIPQKTLFWAMGNTANSTVNLTPKSLEYVLLLFDQ